MTQYYAMVQFLYSPPTPFLLAIQHDTLYLPSINSAVMWEQLLVLIQKFEGDNDP